MTIKSGNMKPSASSGGSANDKIGTDANATPLPNPPLDTAAKSTAKDAKL
ncbi:MAG: hypothetical protein VYE27_07755 [Pseudomonadota bacterium]|nr:hypothetical protein [Pseudomonadota bacterium]